MFFRSLCCIVLPAAYLLAQVPAPAPAPVSPAPLPPGAFLPPPPNPPAPAVPPDQVLITVGEVKVTAADFDRIIDSMPEQYRAAARGPNRRQFADNVVQMLVLAQEGRRRKLDQTPLYQTLARFQGESILATVTMAELGKDSKPDEAELRKYYDEHRAEFEQAHARHILIRFQGSPVPLKSGQKDLTDAEALAKALALRQRIVSGEDFATIATAESDDAGSGAKGGDLGDFSHGAMVAGFEQAAFALKPGEMSEPVKTQFGYHLIKLESKNVKSFEEARAGLESKLGPPRTQQVVQDLVKKAPVTLDPGYFPPVPPAK